MIAYFGIKISKNDGKNCWHGLSSAIRSFNYCISGSNFYDLLETSAANQYESRFIEYVTPPVTVISIGCRQPLRCLCYEYWHANYQKKIQDRLKNIIVEIATRYEFDGAGYTVYMP